VAEVADDKRKLLVTGLQVTRHKSLLLICHTATCN